MASWIRLDGDFFTNDEIVDVTVTVRYAMIAVLSYVKDYGSRGAVKASAKQIAMTKAISEDSVLAALKNGLFSVMGKSIQVLNWKEFQIDPTNAERQAKHRERNSDICDSRDVTVVTPTLRYVTGRDVTPTKNTYVSSEPPVGGVEADNNGDKTLLEFTTVGKEKTWALKESKQKQYQELYPNLDVPQEMRKARQWCIDNPGKRKTPRGMTAFLGRWLRTETDRPRPPAPYEPKPKRDLVAETKAYVAERERKKNVDRGIFDTNAERVLSQLNPTNAADSGGDGKAVESLELDRDGF
jgi:hypothetical protein